MKIVIVCNEFTERPGYHHDLIRIAGHVEVPVRDKFSVNIIEADGLIVDDLQLGKELIESAPNLKVISKLGIHTDNIDVAFATCKSIPVTYTPDRSYMGKAELTVALMFSITKHIPAYSNMIKKNKLYDLPNIDLWRKTLGLIGMDMVAKTVARRALGLGMRVVAYDKVRDKDFGDRLGIRFMDIDEMLPQCDVVSLHEAQDHDMQKIIGANRISSMKRSAYLLNTTDFRLVSESDLLKSLREKWIAGYATSCPGELFLKDREVLESDMIIVVPPVSSKSEDTFIRDARIAVENVLRVFAGEPPHALANKV
jgi:D-3-phosphoglycerate dehydrogenase